MTTIVAVIIVAVIILAVFYFTSSKKDKELTEENSRLRERVLQLSKYEGIFDIDKVIGQKKYDAEKLVNDSKAEADNLLQIAQTQANSITQKAKDKSAELTQEAENMVASSQRQSIVIIENAQKEAKTIAGSAYEIKTQADYYSSIAKAMENRINGYGNEYIIPGRSLIDNLADEYGYAEAAQDFKTAGLQMAAMIKNRTAAKSDYVETNRAQTATDFIIDAFNGKVDTILSKVKRDNYGKLNKELNDAFNLVNFNGQAFRNTRITNEYLDLCTQRLRYATILYELKEKDKEQQRAIKEQMREEAKAQREIEKAMKDAAKEQEYLQKAMEQARAKYEAAGEEQKAKYEQQLADLQDKLKEAEEKNQKALSMAQQTKSGHVYVISNVGSFGEDIYKIGMTRRLEPLDRIHELGDASVPFPFDVHAMIWSTDAPTLETSLHKHFAFNQVNKVNFRKEFFKAPIAEIREEIEKMGVKNISWTMTAEATEYKETQALEKQFVENPQTRDAWLAHDVIDYDRPVITEAPDDQEEQA